WRPFVSGLTVYGSSFYLWGRAQEYMYWGYSLTEPVLMAVLSGVSMHFLLRWLYRHGYSSSSALGIMGSVPLIIISFVLPFLKMHVSLDAFGETYAEAKHFTSEPYVNKYTNVTETTSHPRTTYVESYVRTAPDGDPTNNLSYNGPDAKPPNMQDMQVVKGHFRTVPDGDPTNNLSYHQQAAATESANGDTANSGYESQAKYQSGNEQNGRLATVVYVEQDTKRKN
ncbi:hypothetical protein, partial [Fredinandcohnia sp. 179-A 10B2 NHS]|uniref:hypothetical protein n=1 Tax=Fredinandcohnia sp. 179-A 10B2 NHS TaxID=3235176 RepID=UPI0039A0CF08